MALAYDAVHGILYSATYGRGVWKYQGGAWNDISAGMNDVAVYSLAYDSARNLLYAGGWFFSVWRCASPNTDPTWTSTGTTMNSYAVHALAYDTDRDVLYAGTFYGGVWRCADPDTSTTWTTTGGAISETGIEDLAYDPASNVLFAGTGTAGAWYCFPTDLFPSPSIGSLSASSGLQGSTLTVTGTDFGDTRKEYNGYVSFGAVQATAYTSWSDTGIQVTVPSGASGQVDVTVTTDGGTSNAKSFKVI